MRLIFIVSLSLLAGAYSYADDGPSIGAVDMPGTRGTFEFAPEDHTSGKATWWIDSDGVKPGIAGCHIGADEKGVPNGRTFGEACLANGLLVETNPDKGELHSHSNDIGYPDTFDCNAWCIGNGKERGMCETAPAPPCAQSARCSCK
jgi:hypothetical protein